MIGNKNEVLSGEIMIKDIIMLCFKLGATGVFTGLWIASLYFVWKMI